METSQKVLLVDAASGFYKMQHYKLGDFFGPVDLGLHLAGQHNTLNIGTGLFAQSIFPGSNRMIFSGFSPCWGGFYVSSMGGAGLIFDDLGLNMVSLMGKASTPSVLYLNRIHGEEIQVEIRPIDAHAVWKSGRKGVYSLMDYMFEHFGSRYENDPRILAVGPSAESTDFAGIVSVPITKGRMTYVDTWAGRGGFGSKMLQEHGIVAVIYGGTVVDEDFRDRKVADGWFQEKYQQKLLLKDFESTTKYRFDEKAETGGTFGVNYATMGGRIMAFNYRTIYMTENERNDIHQRFVVEHYLKQFNEETIKPKKQATCGEPCVAVCKKMHGKFKKDYEPYQTMGPQCGIFDQRAAEMLNHHADMLGFDAINVGGVLSWLMDCLDLGLFTPEELGVSELPKWDIKTYDVVGDSLHNAKLGVELLDAIVHKKGVLDLSLGARKFARIQSRKKHKRLMDLFVYSAFGRKGWMVPNQYWTPGVLMPLAIMGKYYMYYGNDFVSPRKLGQMCATRFNGEMVLDNSGVCRFHRLWAEEMLPEIFESLYQLKDEFMAANAITTSRINCRNASVFWESERNMDYVLTFLKRKRDVEKDTNPELGEWISRFEANKKEAALDFWYDVHKGLHESLREY